MNKFFFLAISTLLLNFYSLSIAMETKLDLLQEEILNPKISDLKNNLEENNKNKEEQPFLKQSLKLLQPEEEELEKDEKFYLENIEKIHAELTKSSEALTFLLNPNSIFQNITNLDNLIEIIKKYEDTEAAKKLCVILDILNKNEEALKNYKIFDLKILKTKN